MTKASLPQGMRDFTADVVQKRNFILNNIQSVFELYGFQPLETPAMENLETLMGKYGDEGDKLIFKVLNNGLSDKRNLEKAKQGIQKILEGKNTADITERALKYDLTIPFARFVAMNHAQLVFPFKRYQVQNVWRADRPQKGRYREFTQCDADVVGSSSLINEVELALIYHEAFLKLGLKDYQLKINSRKILTALAARCGNEKLAATISIAIDKLDKIGLEKVKEELLSKGLNQSQINLIEKYLAIDGSNTQKIAAIQQLLDGSVELNRGIDELTYVMDRTGSVNLHIDFTLARGLNYYTGVIFEAKAPIEVKMGSIGGGGRYDDLTGLFGVPSIAGVGISFGIDRIYDVMDELRLFPENLQQSSKVLFFNLGEKESAVAFQQAQLLRNRQIACELFHENSRMDKQFKYAERKNIPFVVIIGSRELENNVVVLKELATGKQETIPMQELSKQNFN